MAKRSYSQYCAVARGLDIVGNRWMLLIVRDLLLGPMRFKDLLSGLPGIGTNLLATRLRELGEAGLVERAVLPPPAGSAVYQLTEAGRSLEPVIFAVGRWGARFLGQPRTSDALMPRPYFVAIRARFRAERAAEVTETYGFRIGELSFEVRVKDGQCTTTSGGAVDPDAVMVMDVETLNALLLEGLSPRTAMTDGRVEITGDQGSLDRFVELFAIREATGAPSTARAS